MFIDHTNVFIEGKKSKLPIEKASDIDYDKLRKTILNGRKTEQDPIIVGSYGSKDEQPSNPFWEHLRRIGFTVTLFKRKYYKEKLVDAEIVVNICERIFDKSKPGTIILISGDSD